VFHGCREAMLRRQAIVDRYDDGPGAVRQGRAGRVDRVRIPDDPATSMEVDDGWERTRARGGVDAHRNLTGGTRDGAIHLARNLFRLPAQLAERGRCFACLSRLHLVQRRTAQLLELLEERCRLRVEWHGSLLSI